ncbi:MAG: nucleoside hydrolase [Bacteroidota bacterium]
MRNILLIGLMCLLACQPSNPSTDGETSQEEASDPGPQRLRVIFDTDANNELDDQHALAYLLFNGEVFDVAGITVNETRNGGALPNHMAEAKRVVALCGLTDKVPVIAGASGAFPDIDPTVEGYDGEAAVEFIVREALNASPENPLVLLPVGKLTNIALAVKKAPDIQDRVRMVWLGSNYPAPGEYNQVNDTAAMSYLLRQRIPFEMVTVRYGEPSGTDAVRVTPAEAQKRLPALGIQVDKMVEGRHGGQFNRFGDYAADLFKHAEMHGDPPSRALFDMAAVAIVKNADWAQQRSIPAPRYISGEWIEQSDTNRQMILWEHFDRDAIIEDFFATLANPVQVY